MRVSLPGYDALTDGTIDHYSMYADSDNILIKEKERGVGTIANNGTVVINHGLGYVPLYFIYVNTQRFNAAGSLVSAWALLGLPNISAEFYSYSGTGSLSFINGSGAAAPYKYFIFYDQNG